MNILSKLNECVQKQGAGFIVLIDPDKKNDNSISQIVESANENGADFIFVGGSLLMDSGYNARVKQIKSVSNIPVILFPGGVNQINEYFDAMLYMSLISGRNPHYLIGEQVIAAPIVHDYELETIPTGYLLIDTGSPTTVEYISGTKSIPVDRSDIVLSHALAGQFLGMKLIYLEAGSGAKNRVSNNIIKNLSNELSIHIIVGGGIRSPEDARDVAVAGASFVVIGSAFEDSTSKMAEFSSAIHYK